MLVPSELFKPYTIFMKSYLALITIMIWPVIPLMWIPVHLATAFFRRLGEKTYLLVAILWAVIAYLIFRQREFIIAPRIELSIFIRITGVILLAAGTLLHIWTASLLTFPGIIGIHEISEPQKSQLVEKGPFSSVRHPTYLAHTMMFLGVFLFTGVIATALLTIADFIVVNLFVIPLEEKELLKRLGQDYKNYMERVPRIIPRLRLKRYN